MEVEKVSVVEVSDITEKQIRLVPLSKPKEKDHILERLESFLVKIESLKEKIRGE